MKLNTSTMMFNRFMALVVSPLFGRWATMRRQIYGDHAVCVASGRRTGKYAPEDYFSPRPSFAATWPGVYTFSLSTGIWNASSNPPDYVGITVRP